MSSKLVQSTVAEEEPGSNSERQYEICQILSGEQRGLALGIDTLIDSLFALFEDVKGVANGPGMNSSNSTTSRVLTSFVKKYDPIVKKLQNLRQNKSDFEFLKRLGKGAFGEVHLVKGKSDGKVYAMKILKKSEMLKQLETAFFMEERMIMSLSRDSNWLTTCYCAFQDDENLFLVMEYVPGGDLMSLLCRRESGTLDEETARFYLAEMVLAIEEIHSYNYVHRDIKPDNILLDEGGHVKLADFGSCIALNSEGLVTSPIAVGTPDYISPEVLRAQEGNVQYGKECDWWSLGIVLYELLCGEPPFFADTLLETYSKIMDYKKHFSIPDDIGLSSQVKDLLKKLICSRENRLGKNGAAEIKAHSFFNGIDFDHIRLETPPFVPKLKSKEDTSMFEDHEEDENSSSISGDSPTTASTTVKTISNYITSTNQIPFIGFSFQGVRFSVSHGSANQSNHARRSRSRTFSKSGNNNPHSEVASIIDERPNSSGRNRPNPRVLQLEGQQKVLEDTVNNLRSEMLKQSLENENLTKSLQKTASIQGVLESELSELRKKVELEMKEKRQLQQQLEQSREKSESAAAAEKQAANASELTREIEALKVQLSTAQSQNSQTASQLESEKQGRSELEKKLKDLNNRIRELSDEKQKANNVRTNLEENLRLSKEKEKYFSDQISDLTQANRDLESKLERANRQVSNMQGSISTLEREKNNVHLEKSELSRKCNDLTNERDEQAQRIKELEQLVSQNKDYATSALEENKARAEELLNARKKMTEEISQKSRQLDILQVELTTVSGKLKESLDESAELRVKVQEFSKQLASESGEKKALQASLKQTRDGFEGQVEQLKGQISELKESHQKTCDDLSEQIKTLEGQSGSLKRQLEESNARQSTLESNLKAESKAKSTLEASISELEDSRNALKSKLYTISNERDNLQQSISAAQTNLQIQQIELDSLKQASDRQIKVRESLELEITDWKKKMELESKARWQLEQDNNVLSGQVEDLRSRNEELMEELRTEVEQRSNLEENLEKQKKKSELDQLKISQLVKKMEGTLMIQQASNASKGGLQIFSSKVDLDKKILKQKQNEIKKLEQRFMQELSQRKALESELQDLKSSKATVERENEELIRKIALLNSSNTTINTIDGSKVNKRTSLSGPLLRKFSTVGAGVVGTLRKKSSVEECVSLDFDSLINNGASNLNSAGNLVLEGWIKIPKSSKGIRFGWTRCYAMTREMSLFIYTDRDSAVNSGVEGKLLFSVRAADAFSVRPAFEKELVNVTAKEAACIFQVRWSAVGLSSSHSSISGGVINDNLSPGLNQSGGSFYNSSNSLHSISAPESPKDAAKILKTLEKEMEVEERLIKGAEALIKISTGNQRLEAEKQLEGSQKRLAMLRAETERLKSTFDNLEKFGRVESTDSLNVAAVAASSSTNSAAVTATIATPNPEEPSNNNNNNPSSERIAQLERDLAKEESFRDAILRIIAATDPKRGSSNSNIAAGGASSDLQQKQLNACQKNIASIKAELEQLKKGGTVVSPHSSSAAGLATSAISNSGSMTNVNNNNNTNNSNQVNTPIYTKQTSISPININSPAASSPSNNAAGNNTSPTYDFNGHSFRVKTFNIPTACQHCHDTLWGFSSQGLECSHCKYVCHKNCYTLIATSCSENALLRSSKPLYVMAADENDRNRWIQGLEFLRKVALVNSSNSNQK